MAASMSSDLPLLYKPKEGDGMLIKKFKRNIEDKYGVNLCDYWDFHRWSIQNTAEFWEEIWKMCGIIHSKSYDKVIDLRVPMCDSPKWFEGARLNFAENLLRHRDDRVAIIAVGEDKPPKKITFAEMYEEASLYAAALRKLGLQKGDVVASYMSNRQEPNFAMQATVSIGAIWTGASPILGGQAALNRFQVVNPKVLLTMDRCLYKQKEIDLLPRLKEISEGLSSLIKIIIVPSKDDSKSKDISEIKNSCWLDDFLKSGLENNGTIPEMKFEQVSFSHPVFIIFTSGTTGSPKGIMHGSGILLSEYKEIKLQYDTPDSSVWFHATPVGWAIWFQYATMHFFGCTLLLYDGFPYFLSPTYMWDLIDDFKITNIHIPATILDEMNRREYLPMKKHHFSSLRVFISGGSVLKHHCYDFVYTKIKRDVIFSGTYGNTETLQSALSFDITMPIYWGANLIVMLGMDLQCVNNKGENVDDKIGELVLGKQIPSLVVGIWGDTDGSLFKEKYFSKYEGKFRMGDYGSRNPLTKTFVVLGRSDDTLNIQGIRIGATEIYNIVGAFPEVADCICVSQFSNHGNERAVLFLKLKIGHQLSENFLTKIRLAIQKELSKIIVPEVILETLDIPYNINGKKLEIVVKNIINNLPFNIHTVANPACLKYFYDVVPPYIE